MEIEKLEVVWDYINFYRRNLLVVGKSGGDSYSVLIYKVYS